MKFVDIKNDIAFRKIFGNENKKEILISFLNAVLKLENQNKIKTITLLNPFQLPKIQGLKVTVIDVKATDEKGNIFIIEMQLTDKKRLDKRIQYYGAKGYSSQIDSGDEYLKLKPMIFIGILDFEYFDSPNYISRHLIMDSETGERKFKDLEFNFIELQKFTKGIKQIDNLVDKWIYFIKNAENLEVIPENINDSGLLTAYKDAEKHNWTKEELEEYEYAQMREQDEKGEIELAEERAVENKTFEIAKEMLIDNEPIEKIIKYTKLDRETIERLFNGMKK
ncbi:MAG: Rpn family recombination-promoting nuclease/putative transposase [Bacteroidales bacterium]|nr:Rpn family recombination-promoting nuclease/putative transposase [Bacteroidales bacterium]